MEKKILIIEDDLIISRLVEYFLRNAGYQVITAPNGLTGLRRVKDDKPDLIILDVMLPGIDGFEVCHQLREEPATSDSLILMLSAKAQEIDRETGIKVGADFYLAKPADPADVVNLVGQLLAKKELATSVIVKGIG